MNNEIITYDDILDKISQIISKSKGSKNTKRICFFDVDENYLFEFDELIKMELVCYELNTDYSKYVNNNILLKFETNKIFNDNNKDICDKLIFIINQSSGVNSLELEIIEDYIVPKKYAKEFHLLTKQLHIGPYTPLSISVAKDKDKLNKLINRGKEQYQRIKKSINLDVDEPQNLESFIESKYNLMINLANKKLLDKKAILFLGTIYNDIEYINLLNDLKKYMAITEKEYDEYYSYRSGKPVYVNSLDELVEYFKNVKDLTITNLESLRSSLGNYELDKLIFELVKNGTFTITDYINYYVPTDDNVFRL